MWPVRTRGLTLLEITVAFGILLTVLVMVWALLSNANRHQVQLWDELVAGELATSALEAALAEKDCAPTPPEGRIVQYAQPGDPMAPSPAMRVVLHVNTVPERGDMLQLRAVATWSERGRPQSLERVTWRAAR